MPPLAEQPIKHAVHRFHRTGLRHRYQLTVTDGSLDVSARPPVADWMGVVVRAIVNTQMRVLALVAAVLAVGMVIDVVRDLRGRR